MRTFQWLFGVEVVLHALDTEIQLVNAIDDRWKILQHKPAGSVGMLGSGRLVSRWVRAKLP